jgi:UPF0716 family protein affecting phage T7 exclusion
LLAERAVCTVLGLIVMGVAAVRYSRDIAASLDRDECLDDRLCASLLLMLAGVILIVPGLLTDFLALLLLPLWTRRFVIAVLKRCCCRPNGGSSPTA